jgi:hypothetical protein
MRKAPPPVAAAEVLDQESGFFSKNTCIARSLLAMRTAFRTRTTSRLVTTSHQTKNGSRSGLLGGTSCLRDCREGRATCPGDTRPAALVVCMGRPQHRTRSSPRRPSCHAGGAYLPGPRATDHGQLRAVQSPPHASRAGRLSVHRAAGHAQPEGSLTGERVWLRGASHEAGGAGPGAPFAGGA